MRFKNGISTRMKNYEVVSKTTLERNIPVAIRIDGRAFHTFTKGFVKPFDEVLMISMQETMKYLCENIQGCVLGYTQSDEITLILLDYQNPKSCAWFNYEVQKMCSIAASMATKAFNEVFEKEALKKYDACRTLISYGYDFDIEEMEALFACYFSKKGQAMFDARCFNIPVEEVTNLIYWRQLDAVINSVQMYGHTYFSHNELVGKSCDDIKDLLLREKNIDWDKIPEHQKYGSCCVKRDVLIKEDSVNGNLYKTKWVIDENIPLFKDGGREYIEGLIVFRNDGVQNLVQPKKCTTIKSEKVLSPQNYIMAVTGECLIVNGDNDVTFIEKTLEKRGFSLWSYAFSEIEHIVSEKLNVVLVECMMFDDKTEEFKHVYRWFEVPDDFDETNL